MRIKKVQGFYSLYVKSNPFPLCINVSKLYNNAIQKKKESISVKRLKMNYTGNPTQRLNHCVTTAVTDVQLSQRDQSLGCFKLADTNTSSITGPLCE